MSETTEIWAAAENALVRGDAATLSKLIEGNEELFRDGRPPFFAGTHMRPDYSGADARTLIARTHCFQNFEAFETFQESLPATFERAVDAVVTGDITALDQLVHSSPELIYERSVRSHHATLLHYAGANGGESFRQRTPANIVAVAELLLRAGSEVDAPADFYGGGATTLELVATSGHPFRAGVLEPLIDLLLAHGAEMNNSRIVRSCLANGRQRGAELVALHGAPLDLEGAAGVGDLDRVKALFDQTGTPQLNDAFAWACQFGRTQVVKFLLDHGVGMETRLRHHGQTGLHWASSNAHLDTMRSLLDRGANVDVRDESFGGTPLGWALHAWREKGEMGDERGGYHEAVRLLLAAGATVDPAWLNSGAVAGDLRMGALLRGDSSG